MSNKIVLIFASVAMMLFTVSCNSMLAPEESQYKKDNDAFIAQVDKGTEYTKLVFLNASYPIYYKVLQKGSSSIYPFLGSTVKMQLSGRLISGEVFQADGKLDSKVNGLIPGVQYALQSMNVGDKWEVVVPQQLGYGAYAKGYTIPAYSTLIFTIELLEVTEQ
ncbi:MAG: FKBP-type peptidyl-prolyl cis-trans isomerase [Bacteroidales bacterium]|uniref:FKBP-type peptidyl-prolyl cis-trans isomerase n=1 Tax=Porphyromonas sp. TaxID=1924944 RepID=UPI0029721D32|nr:FKBP-type peptidyl-prolyl cis-trans isomerase [Porphyromonas sp.]MDD7438053.1 FKBP-type peptidyl-prolyl cis-trans isomerase [Bacteroidales bacterium]MDY3067683.1 FKBP-type peptidyl-prolyl cis-trans isomerase [Porphyromonas sp.]